MKKKILSILLSSTGGLVVMSLVILIPVLMIMDFFGANITDGYVKNNIEYADQYKATLNKYIKTNSGYVSLERILYFYLADNSLSFEKIYYDNLDPETKRLLPISEVCTIHKYKVLDVCDTFNLSDSSQIDETQAKSFAPPIDFTSSSITSFFMEERYVYDSYDIHEAWDLANSAQTPVYSTCDGKVELVSFPYSTNSINKEDKQGGNIIKLSCEVDELEYIVLYAHLYPNSAKVKTGDSVTKGQEIASVGTTGYSTGNHLHFAVSLNGSSVDGMSLIDFTYNQENTDIKPYQPPYFNNPTLPSYKTS